MTSISKALLLIYTIPVVIVRVGSVVCLAAQIPPEASTVVTDDFGDFPQPL
jgi:hypothetical protein